MVSVTQRTSIADLHDRAHRAAFAARDLENWWDGSLETGLAAAAGSMHPPGASRRIGELALGALVEWYDKKRPRAIGEDAAALALGALGAERLRRREQALTRRSDRDYESGTYPQSGPTCAFAGHARSLGPSRVDRR